MLVLARRLNESIIIAKEVRVTVLKDTPTRIELGWTRHHMSASIGRKFICVSKRWPKRQAGTTSYG